MASSERHAEYRVGQLVGGKYRVELLLASGGMGLVYGARHEATGRAVAVKVLRRELVTRADLVQRVAAEARIAVRACHPNVVEVLDAGADADGTPFLVLERLYGVTLEAMLGDRALGLQATVHVLVPIMHALAALHRAGIVHRDVKPSNVFLSHSQAGRVTPKLLDFGIAKALERTGSTLAGLTLGTPAYMAPEQALGCQALGPSTDVWAVGVVLVRCLTGRLPFESAPVSRFEAMRKGVHADDLAGVPASIAAVCRGALRLEPSERIPDMSRLLEALRSAIEDSGAGASWPSEPSVDFGASECELASEVGQALRTPGSDELVSAVPLGRPSHVLTWTMSRSAPRPAGRGARRRTAPVLCALALAGGALLAPAVRRGVEREPMERNASVLGAFAESKEFVESRFAGVEAAQDAEVVDRAQPAPGAIPNHGEPPAGPATPDARHSHAPRRPRPTTASEKIEATGIPAPAEPLLGPNRAPIIE